MWLRLRSLVIVFSLVLDRHNGHGIQCWLEAVKGEKTAGAEIDYQFAKVLVVLYRPANHWGVLKRHECLTDGEYSPFGRVDVFACEECVEAGYVGLSSRGEPYVWHAGAGASGFC